MPSRCRTRSFASLLAAGALAIFAAGSLLPSVTTAGASRGKSIVRRTPAVEALAAAGRIEILEQYGPGASGLLLVRGTPADLDAADLASGSRAGLRRLSDKIHLRARTIETGSTARPTPPGAAAGRLELFQFHGPIKAAWLRKLRSRGEITPIGYVPDNSYIVWNERPGAGDPAGVPLDWRGPLELRDRLSPDLQSSDLPADVSVQVARIGDFEQTLGLIRSRAQAILMEPRAAGTLATLRVTLPSGTVEEIAAQPEVVWIEPFEPAAMQDERSALIVAGQISRGRPLGPGYLDWLAAHGLEDLGNIIVDVTDTGIDSGGTDVHHPGLRGRVAYAVDRTGEGALQDCVGHGTNIAGIIAGGFVQGVSFFDSDGYMPGLGLAPTARLGSTRIFDCVGRLIPNVSFTELVAGAYARGARIGNNSWGGQGTQYNSVDAEYDAVVRDVDLNPLNGEQGFLPVFSAGNFGPLAQSVGWPATAKNVLTVGATENFRPGVSDGCGTPGQQADSVDHVLGISSRGPTADGRVKPDLVAPGSRIQSLASTALGYTGVGVCNSYHPPGQHMLNWSTGTSQAAAHATGAAVIAAEIYRRELGAPPSPAMIKAMLINHAHDMGTTTATPSNTTSRPNMLQGWGRADVGAVAEARARVAFDQVQVLAETGEEFIAEPVVAEDLSRSVIVTLTWTDAPGTPAGWSFVNDLDLVVEADGVTYLGNVLDHGVSVAGGRADERNNIELVVLPPGLSTLSVRVQAANLAGDGVPSAPGETDQDFALYISNARLPTDAGQIAFAQPEAVCGTQAVLRLADRQLRGFGRTSATVASAGDAEVVTLLEDPPGSGLFSGVVDVSGQTPAPQDGVLQTADGREVTASYARLAGATGVSETRQARAVARCSAPAISDVRVSLVGDSEATISWTTDHPATSTVLYGPGTSRTLSTTDPKLVTRHSVRLQALSGCTFHTAQVTSANVAGLSATAPASPLGFSTGPGVKGRRILFEDDMEALSTRWEHAAFPGAVDDWALGYPAFGPPGPFSGKRVWGTRLDGEYSVGSDSLLISPVIDLRDAVGPTLSFMHYYAITGGLTPASQNDGAWVEVTNDGGSTWTPIEPTTGYPDTIDRDNPHVSSATKVYAGALLAWTKAVFDLSPYSGQTIRIRFHLWQDAQEIAPRTAGWYVDDVEVSAQGVCHQARLALDSELYGCASRAMMLLSDSDRNLLATVAESVQATASSPAGVLPVTLTETGPATGLFRAALQLAAAPAPGKLPVTEGDTFSVAYDDADSGGGTPATVTVSAVVSDCAPPPAPTGIYAAPGAAGVLNVTWNPVDPVLAPDLQGYRIHYDSDGSGPAYSGVTAFQGASPVRREAGPPAVSLTALTGCAPHFVTVTAFDRFGNESAFGVEGYAVPNGVAACSNARVSVSTATPGCSEPVALTVSDANADPDPATPGTISLEATGPSDPTGLTVALTETGPASGVFAGTLGLSPSVQAGRLQVAQGDLVTLLYQDADDGRGLSRIARATLLISDCAPPILSDIKVSSRSGDRAVIRWSTDEPATSTVNLGFDPSLGRIESTPGLATTHAVSISGLQPCTTIYYAISSADAHGNAAIAGGSSPLRFGTYREVAVFTDDFESGPGAWTHAGFPASTDEWELGSPLPGVLRGPPAAWSGVSVWGTDLDGPYENGGDMVLVSPPLDLTSADAATLTFRHWYDIFSSGPPDGFDDGAFVEVSVDDGATWTYITPVGGYPDRLSGNPYVPFGSRAYAGLSAGWTTASFILDSFAGNIIRVRFHLVEDPVEVNEGHAGWYIDDVTISRAIACHDALLEMDRSDYPCDGAAARFKLFDVDLDLDSLTRDVASVQVASGAEAAGEAVTLLESGPSTGLFEASLPISNVDAPGVLAVAQDDTVVATYVDADDGSGAARPVVATARVPDCTFPAIGNVQVLDVTSDSLRVTWTTAEPADSRVLFGPTPALGSEVLVPGLRTTHAVAVGGLSPCTRLLFTAASRDAAGNLAREDQVSGPRSQVTGGDAAVLAEDFSGAAPGWSHAGQGDTWIIGGAATPGTAATTPGGLYVRPPDDHNADFVLGSPPIDLSGVGHPLLTLRHEYDFPAAFQGGDGGWVEAWNGSRWITLVPDGGYPAFIDPEAGTTNLPLEGYAGQSPGFVTARLDLSPVAAQLEASGGSPITQIRFHLFVEGGVGPTGTGWVIDDVRIDGVLDCQQGRLVFDKPSLTCADSAAALTLHDKGLDLDPSGIDLAQVTVESSGGPAPLEIVLSETSASSGTFRGTAPLSPAPLPGALRSAPGDLLTAAYLDADVGSGSAGGPGNAGVVTASAPVRGCAPPLISRVRIAPTGGGFVARWATDRPATGEFTLTPPGGPPVTASDFHLATSHRLFVPAATACASYTATLVSKDADGLVGVAGGAGSGLAVESIGRTVLFRDDMEGPNPGWTLGGLQNEWERGVPVLGPPTAFSGQRVFATDLDGLYDGGANMTLISPPIDLTGSTTPRLTFWHWYDIFADTPPNSTDDSAWVEVQVVGGGAPVLVEPIGGYPDTTDAEGGQPLLEGTGVFSGQTNDWEKATFDLAPFAGNIIQLRFRLWNDVIELLINGRTGAGWYLDDLEVSDARFCVPPPAVESLSLPGSGASGDVLQGSTLAGAAIEATLLRPGATASLGPGIRILRSDVVSDTRMTLDLEVDAHAPLGARTLTVHNPDGQAATLAGALHVVFDPARADTDSSGRVDGHDLAALASAFASALGDARYNPAADLNSDGVVDGIDLALMSASFGSTF